VARGLFGESQDLKTGATTIEVRVPPLFVLTFFSISIIEANNFHAPTTMKPTATMAKKKQAQAQTKSVNTNVPKTNEKGEIISWDSTSEDGTALKALFDGGLIATETAKAVKKEHPRFRNCAVRTLNSALADERKRLESEVDAQVKRGSSGVSWLVVFVVVVEAAA